MEQVTTEWVSNYGIISVCLLMIINGSLSVPPSEIILACTGIFVAKGDLPISHALMSAVIGNWLGTSILYFAGRRFGKQAVLAMRKKFENLPFGLSLMSSMLPNGRTIQHYSERHSSSLPLWLFYCRCLPAIRSIVSIPAGISKIHYGLFSFLTVLGALTWSVAWISIGYASEIQKSVVGLTAYLSLVLFSGLIIFLLRFLHQYVSNKRIHSDRE